MNKQLFILVKYIVNTPNGVIDVALTDVIFYGEDSLLILEYTMNSLALHQYTVIVVNMTGYD